MKIFSESKLRQLTIGPSRSPFGRERQRRDASERAAFKRAGMRRTQPGGNRQRFYSTNEKNKYSKTAITSYPSQSAYAQDSLPPKKEDGKGVKPTRDRALFLRRLRRQLKTSRTPRKVHAVDILPRGEYGKNNPEKLMSRGKEYHDAVEKIPDEIKSAGGKSGDKIAGKATEVMSGSTNIEKGREKRRKLYSKKLKATKWDPITKVQVATVKEQTTLKKFSQFIEESKEVLNKISSAYERRYPGMKLHVYPSHNDSIRVHSIEVPKKLRGRGIGSRAMKGISQFADRQNKRVTLSPQPESGYKEKLTNFYKKFNFKSNRGKNKNFSVSDTMIREPKRKN